MIGRRLALATFFVSLLAAGPVRAQSTLDEGAGLVARLSNAISSGRVPRRVRLSLYCERIKVGSLELETTVMGKAIVCADSLDLYFEARPDPVTMKLSTTQRFHLDGRLIRAEMVARAPRASGRSIVTKVSLEPVEGGFKWTRVRDGKSSERTVEAPASSLPLAPPLGLSARLPLLLESGRASVQGLDLETGERTRVRLEAGPLQDTLFRGETISARTVQRREAALELEVLLGPKHELLAMTLPESRLKIVGGLTSDARFMSLPEAVTGAPETPAELVVVAMRALANGEEDKLRRLFDLDALYEAARASRARAGQSGESTGDKGAPADDKTAADVRERFKTALLRRLIDSNRLGRTRASIQSGSLRPSELKTTIKGQEATVTLAGGGSFKLRGGPGAWRIVDVLRPPVDSSQGSPGAEGREGRKASGDGPGPGQR